MSANKNGHSGAHGLEKHGFRNLAAVHWNLTVAELYERAVNRNEGHIARHGPLVALTGHHTGRSATDKFIVRDTASNSHVWWDNNKAMEPAAFESLYQAMIAYAQ
jgi:phosphoenolpyruvate carboxykinase (ATP)